MTGNECAVANLVVKSVVSVELALTGGIGKHHVSESFAILLRAVIEKCVAGQRVSFVGPDCRTREQIRGACVGVVYAVGSIYRAVGVYDFAGTGKFRDVGGSVICQRLGVDQHFVLFLLALEVHVVVEI